MNIRTFFAPPWHPRAPLVKRTLALCALAVAVLLPAQPAHAAYLADQTGKMVRVPHRPQRVVSLAPNITELVFALDAGSVLAGCSQHSDYPPEALRLPRLGSFFRPDLERIAALQPDLCLAVQDGTPDFVRERLEEMGIPVFTLAPQSLEGLREALLLLGVALDRQEEAQRLAAMMDERLRHVDALVAASAQGRSARPRVLVRVQARPFIAAGRDTYAAQLVERAGGRVPLQGSVQYLRLSTEDLLALKPDLILAPEGPAEPLDEAGGALAAPVRGVPEDLLFRPTLRSLDALDLIAALLHREALQ